LKQDERKQEKREEQEKHENVDRKVDTRKILNAFLTSLKSHRSIL